MKFKFIVVSKNEQQTMAAAEFNFPDVEVQFINNNTTSLPILFNELLRQERAENTHDFLAFMHSDVKLNVKHLIDNVERCNDKYDLIGLCGTEVVNISKSPLNWYTSSNPTPEKRWGCVTHGELGNQQSFFSCHHPDVVDHEVGCIDGLCMIFGKKALNSELKFYESLKFDCYDTQISLDAVLKFKLKVGVIVDKTLQHYSVGKQILNDAFFENEFHLRTYFGFDLPEKVLEYAKAHNLCST